MTGRASLSGRPRLAVRLALVPLVMLGLSFAAVPLYDIFCRVTGWGGATDVGSGEGISPVAHMVTVRFDATLARGMAARIAPLTPSVRVRLGEIATIRYRAHNPTARPLTTMASYNVTPFAAGGYFTKVACFCFTKQTLAPGESVDMPVVFYVDPEMLEDREGRTIRTITLSYAFHEVEGAEENSAAFAQSRRGG